MVLSQTQLLVEVYFYWVLSQTQLLVENLHRAQYSGRNYDASA